MAEQNGDRRILFSTFNQDHRCAHRLFPGSFMQFQASFPLLLYDLETSDANADGYLHFVADLEFGSD